jgi:two-component system phosphate regulon sensor histidine kinase PhoR
MGRQAERMTRILRDLIELTKLDSQRQEGSIERVDVAKLLKLITQEFSGKKNIAQIRLELHTDVSLLGSEVGLYSIFYNLIHNAVRFTPAEGEIICTWKLVGSGAEFSVQDSGIGIPEDMISRVTERFFRVDPGRSRELGGTGLGLAIVKHALQIHEATLGIESETGEGSLFRCAFPKERVITQVEKL